MKFEVYKDEANLWRWRFISSNGNNIAASTQGYHNRLDCYESMELIKNNAQTAEVFEL